MHPAGASQRIPGLTVLLPLDSLRAIETALGPLAPQGGPTLRQAADLYERHQPNEIARWSAAGDSWQPATALDNATWSTVDGARPGGSLTVQDLLWGTADLASLGFPASATPAAGPVRAAQLGGSAQLGGVVEDRAVEAARDATALPIEVTAGPLPASDSRFGLSLDLSAPWDSPHALSVIRPAAEQIDLNAPPLFPSLDELASAPRLALSGQTLTG